MDKLRENLYRFINRIKKGAYRQARLSRAAGRRFSQGMRKRLGRLDPQKRLIVLCGGGVVCAAIVAVIMRVKAKLNLCAFAPLRETLTRPAM